MKWRGVIRTTVKDPQKNAVEPDPVIARDETDRVASLHGAEAFGAPDLARADLSHAPVGRQGSVGQDRGSRIRLRNQRRRTSVLSIDRLALGGGPSGACC
jgi:hypothetical protein